MRIVVPTLRELKVLNEGRNMRNLTQYEDAILTVLKVTPGQPVSKEQLHVALYGDRAPKSNCLQTFVSRLRKKGHNIVAARKFGYVFHGSSQDASKFIPKSKLENEGLL